MPRPRKAAKPGLVQALFEFSQATSFHGLRYISPQSSCTRRLMWLVFTLACIVAVIIQIVDRVQHYYSWPLNVNVKINYNQTLNFPAVTICNQNAFRASEAAAHGRYRLIEKMFSQSNNITLEELDYYNATNLSLEELYTSLAHRKQDFIANCIWKNHACSSNDFKTVVTDHGVCYSFIRNGTDSLVSSSGVDAGLRLTLNVEQYEYMTGPHDSAGIKILLHDAREMPFVHGLGQAVPTGTHAFFGVKFMTIENLPEPYGECASKRLDHTDYYTTEECYIDCLVKLANETCGCRDTFMPHSNDTPPVCTLGQYFSCLQDFEAEFALTLREQCGCPVPCHFAIYDPSVSYASVSNHLVNKLLTSKEADKLRTRLETASEVTAKMDTPTFVHFRELADNYVDKYSKIKTVIQGISSCLKTQENYTAVVLSEMKNVYLTKERIYRYQEYSIEKNFLRGREAMEERTLSSIVNAYAEFALVNYKRILRLAHDNDTSEDVRLELYRLVVDSLQSRREICEMARNNVSMLISSYIEGKPIFNYKFEDLPRSHNPYIVPKPLMNYSMHHNHYMLKYVPKLQEDDFDLFNVTLGRFIDQATIAFDNHTVNETELHWVYERFQYVCRTYMFSKSVVYSLGIELPLKVIQERHFDFDNVWGDFDSGLHELQQNINSLASLIKNITTEFVKSLDTLSTHLTNYSENSEGRLMDIARVVLSNETQANINAIRNFFREVQTRGQLTSDLLSISLKPILTMWSTILGDVDTIDYYTYTNNTLFLRNLTEVQEEWTQRISDVKSFDVRGHVLNIDEDFFTAFDELSQHLDSFEQSIVVDSSFLRQNFLQLDIFYRQLSYEYINQQKAYDFYALVSDIGGAMGLFIGASMLTLLEIIDLLLIQLPIFKYRKDELEKKKGHTYA